MNQAPPEVSHVPRLRIMLVDDQPLIRAGVRRVLDSEADLHVVAEASDGVEALALLEHESVDVVVLDLSMPGLDGFAVLRVLRSRPASPRVLVLSLHDDPGYVARAVREGADGYLLKETAVHELARAIRAVTSGAGFYSPGARDALHEAMRAPTAEPFARLTPREVDVLRAVALGKPSKAIAAELGIGVRTVETHRANVMKKLELRSIAELTRFAMAHGLIPPP